MSKLTSIFIALGVRLKALVAGYLRLYAIVGPFLALIGLLASDPTEPIPWMGLTVVAGPGLAYYGYRFITRIRSPDQPTPE